jgi:hypothetical protein
MSSQILAGLFASLLIGSLYPASLTAQAQATPTTVGIIRPRGTIGQGVDISAPLRDALADALRSAGVQVVALDASDPAQAMTEAAQKNCAFMLYTMVSQGRGAMGLGKKMSMIMPHKPSAADTPYAIPTEEMKSLPAAEKVVVKAGDPLTLEYRLMARGADVHSGKLDGKALKDGEDVLGSLVAQLSTTVASAANGGQPSSTAAAQTTSSASAGSGANGRAGRGNGNAPPNQGMPPNMDCEQMAAISRGTITVESCKQMMSAQKARESALADPRASRSGDDKMTCDQIAAEIKQQPIKTPDAAKVAEAQAAAADVQRTAAKQQAEVQATAVKDAAEELAKTPERLFEPNAVGAAREKEKEAERKAKGERMAAEMKPKAEREMTAGANLVGDFGKQLEDNPRLAKLFEMATQKHCQVR